MIMIQRPSNLKSGPAPPDEGIVYLPRWFKPSDKDVICGWAKQNHLHAGNQRFRQLVESTAPLYVASQTKQEKTKVIASVVERVRQESPSGGGFIKRDLNTGLWFEIGNDKARDKVGHAIRRVIQDSAKKKKKMPSLAEARAFNRTQSMPNVSGESPAFFMGSDSDGLSMNPTASLSSGLPTNLDSLPSMDASIDPTPILPQSHRPNLAFGNMQDFGTVNPSLFNNSLRYDSLVRQTGWQQNQPIPTNAFIGAGLGKVDKPTFNEQESPLAGAPSFGSFQYNQTKHFGQHLDASAANSNKNIPENNFNFTIPDLQKSVPSNAGTQSSAAAMQPVSGETLDPHSAFFPLDDAGLDELFSTDSGKDPAASGETRSLPNDPRYSSRTDNRSKFT
eukprot:scaffold1475_cov111-Cylindrotheca_fusiformis.AAC.6